MGFWAGIKHALNSTLGTDDFKPLNEMILGMRQLQASDEVYLDLEPLETSTVSSDTTKVFSSKQSITPYSSGSLKLKITYFTGGMGFGGSSNVFNVLVNGAIVSSVELDTAKTSYEQTAVTDIIRYEAGDRITFNTEVSPGPYQSLAFSCNGIYVLGTLTEFNALNVKSIV